MKIIIDVPMEIVKELDSGMNLPEDLLKEILYLSFIGHFCEGMRKEYVKENIGDPAVFSKWLNDIKPIGENNRRKMFDFVKSIR